MNIFKLTLAGATLLGVVMLGGCGGGGGDSAGSTSSPTATPAETIIGVELLPPDGSVSAATTLSAGDMAPDAAATPGSEEMPPI